jgi:PrgI family protein
MMFSVPQFIDVEDKIVGPLTWKQLLWMVGMGAALLTFFNIFEKIPFVIISIPTVLLFTAFAFYRPNGFPMTTFVFYSVLFLFRPKVSVWERPTKEERPPAKASQETPPANVSKKIEPEKLAELARILDKGNGK